MNWFRWCVVLSIFSIIASLIFLLVSKITKYALFMTLFKWGIIVAAICVLAMLFVWLIGLFSKND